MLIQLSLDEDTQKRLRKIARDMNRTVEDLCECAVSEAALGACREVPQEDRTIRIIGPDDFAECPTCHERIDVIDHEADTDEDGPIMEAVCVNHGLFRFQVQEDQEEEDHG